jgi:GH24 family phage-related lysozyme (muramidase)
MPKTPDLDAIQKLIAQHEGSSATVYTDTAGNPTVGIGFNLNRPNARAAIGAIGVDYDKLRAGAISLTQAQITALFQSDVAAAISDARRLVSNFEALPSPQQQVVVDMIFNLGAAGFKEFKQTIAAIESLNFSLAAEDMIASAWCGQVGTRCSDDVALMRQRPV